jgi:F0F1-type ATP synthase membrane subunit c/vacuolar-type H+-ATPase subunit K
MKAEAGSSNRLKASLDQMPDKVRFRACRIRITLEEKMDTAGLTAIGAGLAVGLAAIGTGLAQARIGSAGAGVIAEKPEALGTIIVGRHPGNNGDPGFCCSSDGLLQRLGWSDASCNDNGIR